MGKFASLSSIFGGQPSGGGGLKSSLVQQARDTNAFKGGLPKRGDTEVQDAAKRAKSAALRRRGRGSTILTGGRGLLDDLASQRSPEAKSTLG